MKVLVLGGTGAMGVHLVQMLSNNGIETFVTSRKVQSSGENIHYIQGNAHDIEFLLAVLQEQWDAIVDFMVYSTSEFKDRIDVLLNATSQYIFLSSARVYADAEQPLTENSPRLLDVSRDKDFLSTDEYSLTKARQENILKSSGRNNWTIIRPYITYSEDRLQLGVLEKEEWLYRALQGRTIVFSRDMMDKTTVLTYGFDVAKGIISIIGRNNTLGEVFHITTYESIKWSKVLDIYLLVIEEYLGYKPKVLLLNMNKFLIIKPTKYQTLYDRVYNREFDNSKFFQYIDKNNLTKIEIGLKNCIKEFLNNPEFKHVNWRTEAKKDKLTKENTPLTEIQYYKHKIKYLFYRYIFH